MNNDFKTESHPIVFMKPRVSEPRSWVQHIPFAYLVIDLLRPRLLVELGTHSGNSYLAFCQAVAELKAPTRCFAVDSWAGDVHAQSYGESVFDALQAYHQPRYATFSTLLRRYFDDAVGEFQDGSIDLLHIDGLHTYEAVRHDFESWLPKLSDRAVVLFHDVAVRERGFGVWKFFAEVSERYDGAQFEHGNGLGILLVGDHVPEPMRAFVSAFRGEPSAYGNYFHALGKAIESDAHTDFAPIDADCRLYYRSAREDYDDARQVCLSRERDSDLSLFRFRVAPSSPIDYIRLDPAETPGVFRLQRVAVIAQDFERVSNGEDLAQRIVGVDGRFLARTEDEGVRWAGIGTDPNMELRVDDLMPEDAGDLVIEATLAYESVVEDPTAIRVLSEMGVALSDRSGSLLAISERLAEIERRLPLDIAHISNLVDRTISVSEASLARANEFAPEIARASASTFEIGEGIAALHDSVLMQFAESNDAIASVKHAINGSAQHDIDARAIAENTASSIEAVSARLDGVSRELDAVSQGLHTVSFRIEASLVELGRNLEAVRHDQSGLKARMDRRRWWRWW